MSNNNVKRPSRWMENYEEYNTKTNYYSLKKILKGIVDWG